MSGPKEVSEYEAVMRERDAFHAGVCFQEAQHRESLHCRFIGDRELARDEGAERYPLPKVERPRVVDDPHDIVNRVKWRFVAGRMQWREAGGEWCAKAAFAITPERVELWAALLANPTELVSDSGDTA